MNSPVKAEHEILQMEIPFIYHVSTTGLNQVSRQNWDKTSSPLQNVRQSISRIRQPRIRGSMSFPRVTKYESASLPVLMRIEELDHWTVPVHGLNFSSTNLIRASLRFICLTSLLIDIEMSRGGGFGPPNHSDSSRIMKAVASMGRPRTGGDTSFFNRVLKIASYSTVAMQQETYQVCKPRMSQLQWTPSLNTWGGAPIP